MLKKNKNIKKEKFIDLVKKEFKNGFAKLLGWVIPMSILIFLLRPIVDISLEIKKVSCIIESDKSVLSPDNFKIEGGEFSFDKDGNETKMPIEKQKPLIKFQLEGKGKVDKAFYFYKLDQYEKDNNHITKYEFDIKSNFFCDILQRFCITPDSLELPCNLNIRARKGKLSRSYLAIRDANNKEEYKIYLINLSKIDGIEKYETEIIDEKKIYQTAPDIYEKESSLVEDLEDVSKELQEIKFMLYK